MKPAGRSLEIVAIGLGQAGGNLAAEFQRRGYRALAFNTAETDLTSLGASRLALPASQRIYIGLSGFDGAGSDMAYGRECITAHADRIREAVAQHAAGADVLVVAAGLGGGTGSCAADLTALLEDLSLPVVLLTALPHAHESGIAKVNALCSVRDLAKNPAYGWVIIDNARLAKLHHEVPIDTYFETINRDIVEPLDLFNRLNDRDATRAIRTLDGEDFRNLLLSGGVLNYHTRVLPKLSADGVMETVRTALADNPIMPRGSDLANVAYLGLVIEASERALAESPFSIYEEIAQQVKTETGGAAVYVGLYRQLASDDTTTTVRLLSSSRALPASISEMLTEAEREVEAIRHKMEQNVATPDLGDLEQLRLVRRPVPRSVRAAPRPSEDADAQRSESHEAKPVPGPMPEPGAPPAMRTARVDELRRMIVSAAATVAEVPAAHSTQEPSRGRYERLANAFRDTKADDRRVLIARELVAGQRSSEPLERFYAVNAMARVDANFFREELHDASADADPHVADLARRALEKLANAG